MTTFATIATHLRDGIPTKYKTSLMSETIALLLKFANRLTPEQTGFLKRGNQSEVVASGDFGRIYNQVPYAQFVHDGTKPHPIYPKKAGGFLVFQVNGKTVFARKVNHPGTKSQPFYQAAIDQSAGERGRLLQRTGDQIVASMAR